ncbi:MAG: alpha/beta fold hydrolase [Planctomycetota bacterium]
MTHDSSVPSLAYERDGKGAPVVLLHGLGANRRVWRKLLPSLSSSYDVIAIDLLGFGDSPKPLGSIDLRNLADTTIALLDDLRIKQVHLVGNSLGGWLALSLALTRPDRVMDVIAIAPAFLHGMPEGLSAETLAAAASPKSPEQMRAYMGRVTVDAGSLSDQDIETLLSDRLSTNDEHAIRQLAQSIQRGDHALTGQLDRITSRVLVLHGRHDGVVSLAQSESVAAELHDTSVRVLEGSAHWPQLDEPREVASIIRGFLR